MKDINGYEGLYAVTSCGKVWGYKRKRFLSPRLHGGYLRVALSKNGVTEDFYVQRIVAETYIPNPNNLPQVNHKDENKENNCVKNLEWCDAEYNINYGTRNARVAKNVRCVELNKTYNSITEAAHDVKVTVQLISACLRGLKKTAGKYHWEYI